MVDAECHMERGTSTSPYPSSSTSQNRPQVLEAEAAMAGNFDLAEKIYDGILKGKE